jgi:hypothetical protein
MCDDGYSDWEYDVDEPLPTLTAELGEYTSPPPNETFDERYVEHNWHLRTWSLREGRPQFRGPLPGPTEALGGDDLTGFEIFLHFWDDSVMRKIVVETNRYPFTMDHRTGGLKGGRGWVPITL